MPRDYAKFRSRFWTGQTGKAMRSLGQDAQLIAAYLITCGSSNMIGLYYLPLSLLCHETGIPMEGARKALRSLSDVDFAHYDEDEEVVFVTRMAPEQIEEQLEANDKRCAGVARELKEYEKSRFFGAFVFLYRVAFNLPKSMGEGSPLEGPCMPLGSQEQEQEYEQEQEQDSDCGETEGKDAGPQASLLPPEPPILTFPCDGKCKSWCLQKDHVESIRQAFPSLDVEGECRKAYFWIESHPAKRKTAKGMLQFLFNWMNNSQNRGGGTTQAQPQQASLRIGHTRAEDFKHDQIGEIKL